MEEFKIGNVYKCTHDGFNYSTYHDFFKLNNIELGNLYYQNGARIITEESYELVYIGSHDSDGTPIGVFKDLHSDQVHLYQTTSKVLKNKYMVFERKSNKFLIQFE